MYIAAGCVGAVVIGIIAICCYRHKVCCFKHSEEQKDESKDREFNQSVTDEYAVVKKRGTTRPDSDVSYKSNSGFVDVDLISTNPSTALQSGLPESYPSQPVSQGRGNPLHDSYELGDYKPRNPRGPLTTEDDKYTFYTGQTGTSDRTGENGYDRLNVGDGRNMGSGERDYTALSEKAKHRGGNRDNDGMPHRL